MRNKIGEFLLFIAFVIFITTISNTVAINTYIRAHDAKANDGQYEKICIDIDSGDGCYFMMYADIEIDTSDEGACHMSIRNPEILAYDVTEKYESGVYIIDGKYIDDMEESVRFIRKSVMDIYDNPAIYYVDSLYNFVMEGTVVTKSPT